MGVDFFNVDGVVFHGNAFVCQSMYTNVHLGISRITVFDFVTTLCGNALDYS
jgi:hypothetical protein